MNESSVGAPPPHLPNPHPPLLEQLKWLDPLGIGLLEALERGNLEAASSFVLRYCSFTPTPQIPPEVSAALGRAVSALDLSACRCGQEPRSSRSAQQLMDTVRAKGLALARERFPSGYGGRPEFAALRRRLLEDGTLSYSTDFAKVEAQLANLLENGDLHTLSYYLCPPENSYSRFVFEFDSGLKLPRTQSGVRELLRGYLSTEALERGEVKELERQAKARAAQIEALAARLSRRAVQLESGPGTLLEWADSLLEGDWVWRKVPAGKTTRRELYQPKTRLSYPRPDAVALEYLILKGLPEG